MSVSATATPMTTTTTTQALIQIVTNNMTYYGPIIVLIIGVIGCLCNFITFTSPQLRKTSCSFYFLISAVFELLSITFGLISRFAADHLGSTLINTDSVYCRTRAYLVSAIPLAATYLILLASIDRFMSSSVHARLRSFSQMKIAYRATLTAILLAFITCSHILVSYDLRPRCATMPGAYATFDGLFVVFWLGVIPHVLMLVFGFLTFMNIRKKKQRIAANKGDHLVTTLQHPPGRDGRKDRQLMIMVLFQVGFSTLLIMARMIYYAYYILAPPLTGYNRLIGSFLMSFTTLLYYANYAKSFYIYTLSSHLFRSIFVQRIKSGIRKFLGPYTSISLRESSMPTVEANARTVRQRTNH